MPRRRYFAKGAIYHITNRGKHQLPIFRDYQDYLYFLTGLSMVIADTGDQILAFCLMPNHFHLLIRAANKRSISDLLQKTCTSYVRKYNNKYHHYGSLFQGRFHTKNVTTIKYLKNVSRYIHRNPLEDSRLDINIETYPWSSFRNYINKNCRAKVKLHKEFVLKHFDSIEQYRNFCIISEYNLQTRELNLGIKPDQYEKLPKDRRKRTP